MKNKAIELAARIQARALDVRSRSERGDLVGWLLIAVMTAALIAVVWATLGDQLQRMIERAMRQATDAVPS